MICPLGVTEAIAPVEPSPNHTLPSGPTVMNAGLLRLGVRKLWILPCGVMTATLLLFASVNQKLPSGACVMSKGAVPPRIGKVRVGICAITEPPDKATSSLLNARGRTLDANDNWMDNPDADRIVAVGLQPTDPLESAMIDPLRHGTYTFVEQGTHRVQGVALPEIYDLSDGGLQLSAVGTRGLVSTEDNVMISGFIIADSSPISLLIRALGPSLADAGLHRVLPDPLLELHDGDGNLIFSNDNWRDTQEAEIEATGLAPTNDLESAMVVDLFPGKYAAVFSGVGGTTGLGFLQIYSLDLPIRELNPAPIIRGRH